MSENSKDSTFWSVNFSSACSIENGQFSVEELKAKIVELSAKADFLQTLLDSNPSPVFYKYTEGIYVGCNKAFEEFIGADREQIVGKTAFDIAPPDLAAKYHMMDVELFRTGKNLTYEWKLRRADGVELDVIFHKSPFIDSNGKVAGLVGVISDITKMKQIETDLRKKIHELEVFYEATLDREKRIIELKKEIESLKTQLGKK